jgi:hypothetical protein
VNNRRIVSVTSAILLLMAALACRVGTPTPTVTTSPPTPTPSRTPLPTITPLPSLTPPPGDAVVLQQATVTDLFFFEGGTEPPDYGERSYDTRFSRARSRYIYYEINFEYPEPGERVDFAIDSRWYDAAGDLFNEQSMDAWFEADWTSSAHAAGYGWDKPGKWTAGEYRVELLVSGQPIISGTFEIR